MAKHITSSLPPLKPHTVWDVNTGEELRNWTTPVTSLLKNVTDAVKSYYEEYAEKLHGLDYVNLKNLAEYGRQQDITLPLGLPARVKAQSRVQRLARHKLISEVASYVLNPNPRKQTPSFTPKLNLGAVDKQMASLSLVGDQLTLHWKCWDKELLLEFTVPSYVLKRTISKWSLPTVQYSRKTGELVFNYSIQEPITLNKKTRLKAGLDLGRAQPYTMVVLNETNRLVAQYVTSKRLQQLNNKRERLLIERSHILTKLTHYDALGYAPEQQVVLRTEASRKRGKITRLGNSLSQQLGSEVSRKLTKHSLNTLNLENLKWVRGKKYGSRWNHSAQQTTITHSLSRQGVRTQTVNPRNTSQTCHSCGSTLVHNAKTRTVWCGSCKSRLDRDFNAALNIAKNTHLLIPQRDNEGNPSPQGQVTVIQPGSYDSSYDQLIQLK